MRRLLSIVSLIAITACGGAGGVEDLTKPPVDTTTKPLVDPYATFYVEYLLTPAAGKRQTTYDMSAVLDSTFGAGRVASVGTLGTGHAEQSFCWAGVAGYVGLKTLQLVGVGDTLQSVWLTPDSTRRQAAIGTASWPGLVRITTGVFDPLVSADTSRGHTRQRPVMWRWTISDSGLTIREDSTTACNFQA